jgi:hypothetical protein
MMKNKRNIITTLIIVLSPFIYKFSLDIYKMGIKDGKAHAIHRNK